jgi:hypothetical protein
MRTLIDKTIDLVFDKAISAFAKAHNDLWDILRYYSDHLPQGSITCGMIAEYYAKLYLDWKFDGATIQFGSANEKGWDLLLQIDNAEPIKYQVKAISAFNRYRRTSAIGGDCDRLIVTSLDSNFHPHSAYLIENVHVLSRSERNRPLVVPDPLSRRRTGSTIFREYGLNITDEFLEALAI